MGMTFVFTDSQDRYVYIGGTEKHTCALTSGTFMCCNVGLMSKTSGFVCEKAVRHQAEHLQQL